MNSLTHSPHTTDIHNIHTIYNTWARDFPLFRLLTSPTPNSGWYLVHFSYDEEKEKKKKKRKFIDEQPINASILLIQTYCTYLFRVHSREKWGVWYFLSLILLLFFFFFGKYTIQHKNNMIWVYTYMQHQ